MLLSVDFCLWNKRGGGGGGGGGGGLKCVFFCSVVSGACVKKNIFNGTGRQSKLSVFQVIDIVPQIIPQAYTTQTKNSLS